MNEDKNRKGRQWEEGVLLPVSDDFFAKKSESKDLKYGKSL